MSPFSLALDMNKLSIVFRQGRPGGLKEGSQQSQALHSSSLRREMRSDSMCKIPSFSRTVLMKCVHPLLEGLHMQGQVLIQTLQTSLDSHKHVFKVFLVSFWVQRLDWWRNTGGLFFFYRKKDGRQSLLSHFKIYLTTRFTFVESLQNRQDGTEMGPDSDPQTWEGINLRFAQPTNHQTTSYQLSNTIPHVFLSFDAIPVFILCKSAAACYVCMCVYIRGAQSYQTVYPLSRSLVSALLNADEGGN